MVCVINHYSWFAKLKQRSIHALLIAFVVASILFLLPNAALDYDSGFTSSELEVKETVEENAAEISISAIIELLTKEVKHCYKNVLTCGKRSKEMNRELDGCYFRIVRDGVGQSECFTDLTKAERDALLADKDTRFLKNLCSYLADRIQEPGNIIEEQSQQLEGGKNK